MKRWTRALALVLAVFLVMGNLPAEILAEEMNPSVQPPAAPQNNGAAENTEKPQIPEGDGNTVKPQQPEGDGNTVKPQQPEGDGNTVKPQQPEGDGNTVKPQQPENEGNTPVPQKPEDNENTVKPQLPTFAAFFAVKEQKKAAAPTEADIQAAAAWDQQVAGIGEVTLEKAGAIAAAREAYKNLPKVQRRLVKNEALLASKEAALAELQKAPNQEKANAVDMKIAALLPVSGLTLENEGAVQAARQAYKDLNKDQKALVSGLADLEAAEAQMGALNLAVVQPYNDRVAALDLVAVGMTAGKQELDALYNVYNNTLTPSQQKLFSKKQLDRIQGHYDAIINANQKIAAIGDVTPETKDRVPEAQAAYEAVPKELRVLVTGVTDLQNANAAYQALENLPKAQAADKAITDLGDAESLTLEKEAAVQAARAQYDGLTDAQKKLTTKLPELKAAERKIRELNQLAVADINALIAGLDLQNDGVAGTKEKLAAIDAAKKKLSETQKTMVNLDRVDTVSQNCGLVETANQAIADIGEVNAGSGAKIAAARTAFDAVPNKLRSLVDSETKLKQAEQAFGAFVPAVKNLDDKIAGFPNPVILENEQDVLDARSAYDLLPENQKRMVRNLSGLEAAEQEILRLNQLAVKEINEKINALDLADYAQTGTDLAQIDSLYAPLSDTQKALVKKDRWDSAKANYDQVKHVVDLIDAIGEVTAESGESIDAARYAYDSLLRKLQEKVPADKVTALEAAEAKYIVENMPDVKAVVDKIDAIGDVTAESGAAIQKAEQAYHDLLLANPDHAKLVNNLNKLEQAKKALPIKVAEKQLQDLAAVTLPEDAQKIRDAEKAYTDLNGLQQQEISQDLKDNLTAALLELDCYEMSQRIDALDPPENTAAYKKELEAVERDYQNLDQPVKDALDGVYGLKLRNIRAAYESLVFNDQAKAQADLISGMDLKKLNETQLNQLKAGVSKIESMLKDPRLTPANEAALTAAHKKAQDYLNQRNADLDTMYNALTAIFNYEIPTVKSSDKTAVEAARKVVSDYLKTYESSLTAKEKEDINLYLSYADALLDRIAAAAAAKDTLDIREAAKINRHNVQFYQRKDLQEAKADLDYARKYYKDNYTEDELKALDADLLRVNESIWALDRAERVAWMINQLPSSLTPGDNDTMLQIENTMQEFNYLSPHEKDLVGNTLYEKLDDLYWSYKHYQIAPMAQEPGSKDLVFQATGDLKNFVGVKILPFNLKKDEDYTVKASKDKDGKPMIEITLKEEFLSKLNPNRRYQLVVDYSDGIAVASLRNRKITSTWIPKTGDYANTALWCTLMVTSMAGMALYVLEKKRKKF